jgi:nucleotide-binding universal stress UspA family protein
MAGLEPDDGDVMAKRILVPVERTKETEFALRVARMIARESGGVVRLLRVVPIPEPLRDRRDRVILTTDQQMERIAAATTDELTRMAAVSLEGVVVETSVVFGERAVEIGVVAACFHADLVVMPPSRRGLAAWIASIARRLLADRPASGVDVLRVWALRPEPMI